ncbi:hypothetical protein [Azoarcus olearius]|uniref:hypothetical protein n=1 Tax=Azoarcus sp. (strain BH72) TaxID=418699 RepID=UPI001470D4F4|nr:hypothetical protein [Azoarcus olearius]
MSIVSSPPADACRRDVVGMMIRSNAAPDCSRSSKNRAGQSNNLEIIISCQNPADQSDQPPDRSAAGKLGYRYG